MLKGIEQNGRAEEEKEKTSGGEKEKEKSHESEICSFHLFTYAIVVSRNPDARPPPPNQYSPSFCHPDHIETKPDAAVFIHRFQPTNKQTANAAVALPAPAGN